MNPHRGINDNNKKDRNKATAAIPMVGAIVTAALLLSGVSLIGGYQPAIAQEEITDGGAATDNATETMGGVLEGGNATTNATTTDAAAVGNQSEVRLHIEEALMALQNNDTQGAQMHLELALSVLGDGNMTGVAEGNMTGVAEGNMTGTTEATPNMTTDGTEGEATDGTEGEGEGEDGGILGGIFG